jgi:hypothetical protein
MKLSLKNFLLRKFSGGLGERETPVPIPNTEVKPLSVDGTARATVWESRTLPGIFLSIQKMGKSALV